MRRLEAEDLSALGDVYRLADPLLRLLIRERIARSGMAGQISEDDISQEVWHRAYRRLSRLRQKGGSRSRALLAYLATIARHVLVPQMVAARRRLTLTGSSLAGSDGGPATQAVAAEGSARAPAFLETCLSSLSAEDRQILRLRGMEGASAAVVASKLGLSADVVHTRYSRIRADLRKQFGKAFVALLS